MSTPITQIDPAAIMRQILDFEPLLEECEFYGSRKARTDKESKTNETLRKGPVLPEAEHDFLQQDLQNKLLETLSSLLQALGAPKEIWGILEESIEDPNKFAPEHIIQELLQRRKEIAARDPHSTELIYYDACIKQAKSGFAIINSQRALLAKKKGNSTDIAKLAVTEMVMTVTNVVAGTLQAAYKIGGFLAMSAGTSVLIMSVVPLIYMLGASLYPSVRNLARDAKFLLRRKMQGTSPLPDLGPIKKSLYNRTPPPAEFLFDKFIEVDLYSTIHKYVRAMSGTKLGHMSIMRANAAKAAKEIAKMKYNIIAPSVKEFSVGMNRQLDALQVAKFKTQEQKDEFLEKFDKDTNKLLHNLASSFALATLGETGVNFSTDKERNALIQSLSEKNKAAADELSRAVDLVTQFRSDIKALSTSKSPMEFKIWRDRVIPGLRAILKTSWIIKKSLFVPEGFFASTLRERVKRI